MIRKLQYGVHNKPYITHIVEIVSRFSFDPKEAHMIAVKWIFKCLKGIEDY